MAEVFQGVATPINAQGFCGNGCNQYDDLAESAAEALGFSDEIPCEESEETKEAKNFLKNFSRYIKSSSFKKDVKFTAKKYKLPEKSVAKGIIGKILGILGDIAGIIIDTTCNVLDFIVNAIDFVLHGAVSVIHGVASGLARVITFNKTCVA